MWLRDHWRPVAAGAAIGVAFAAGRMAAPTRVETRTQEHVVYQDRVVEKKVEAHSEAKTLVVYRDRSVITEKDGTVIHRDVERAASSDKTAERAATSHAENHVAVKDRTVEKIVERDAPRWSVSALAGLSLNGPPVYGAAVQYRLLGPISVGAWGLSSGVGGVSLGLSF